MKKAIVITLILAMVLALTATAIAGNNKIVNEYVEGAELKQDFNNAQFHCNAINGNGRVWPVIPADMKKFDGKLTFTKATGTRWDLSAVEDKKGVSLDMVVCPECGSTAWITFSNNSGEPDGKNIQMQHPGDNITIIKDWIKNNEPYPIGFKFTSNFEVTLSSGKIFKLSPGKYFLPEDLTATVKEISCSTGFKLVKFELNGVAKGLDKICGVKSGDVIKATNEDEKPYGFSGSLNLLKTVEGELIAEWELNGVGIADVIDDISFNIFKANVDSNGDPIGYNGSAAIATGELDVSGEITFVFDSGPAINGWYAVVESFTPGSIAEQIFEDAGPLYVFFVDGVGVAGAKTNFDYGAFYTIINGHGSGYTLGYPGLNNTGDIFPIGIESGDKKFPSFCANAGSHYFAGQGGIDCSGYYVSTCGIPNGVPYADFLKAYNYIESKYNVTLDEVRPVTQIITWALLGAIEIPSDEFNAINWTAVAAGTGTVNGVPNAKAIVEDVMANYNKFAFNSKGNIVDVVFLVCDKHDKGNGHDFVNCQPQLVPIYGSSSFDNKIKPPKPDGGVSFNKVKYGGLLPVGENEFFFDLFKIDNGIATKIGVYGTNVLGVVTAENLAPGSYVFREIIAHADPYVDSTGSFALVYKAFYPKDADGLYFTINANGAVTWRDTAAKVPTVNNEFYSKSYLIWVPIKGIFGCNGMLALSKTGERIILDLLGENSNYDDVLIVNGGFIRFGNHSDNDDWALAVWEYSAATCTQNANMYLSYGDETPAMGGIELKGTALGHDFSRLSDDGVCLGCSRCPLATYYQELTSAELANAFLDLVKETDFVTQDGQSYYEYALAWYKANTTWF